MTDGDPRELRIPLPRGLIDSPSVGGVTLLSADDTFYVADANGRPASEFAPKISIMLTCNVPLQEM